jgi:hypothetical protein
MGSWFQVGLTGVPILDGAGTAAKQLCVNARLWAEAEPPRLVAPREVVERSPDRRLAGWRAKPLPKPRDQFFLAKR